MKCIITICTNKRAALPYIFGKYCFPVMKSLFCGEMKLFHIFHNFHAASRLASGKLSSGRLNKVKEFIYNGMYSNAEVIEHTTDCSNTWPALASVKLAARLTIKENADFHLWMEDDAIVYDTSCNKWATTLGSADVGLYRDTFHKGMINTAYFLSTKEFDSRLIPILEEFKATAKDKASLIEGVLHRTARQPVLLEHENAIRNHHSRNYTRTKEDIKNWLKDRFPKISMSDLALLDLDFDN